MGKLTRRDFLSTLTATAAAAYLPPALRKESGFEFVYFTDTHVAFERNVAECRGMLAKIRESRFVAAVEDERFDATQPGILRFDVTLLLEPAEPL